MRDKIGRWFAGGETARSDISQGVYSWPDPHRTSVGIMAGRFPWGDLSGGGFGPPVAPARAQLVKMKNEKKI